MDSPAFLLIITGLSWILGIIAKHFISEELIKRKYKSRIEPVFVVSSHPETGEPPKIGGLKEFCIFADCEEVISKANLHRRLMKESGNPFFESHKNGYGKTEEEDFSLQIIAIPFQEGRFVNEKWKNYGARLKHLIKDERAKLHEHHYQNSKLYAKKGEHDNAAWYHKNMNGQQIPTGSVIEF